MKAATLGALMVVMTEKQSADRKENWSDSQMDDKLAASLDDWRAVVMAEQMDLRMVASKGRP
jgi:hypothetical protein